MLQTPFFPTKAPCRAQIAFLVLACKQVGKQASKEASKEASKQAILVASLPGARATRA